MNQKILEELGLSPNEARIYESLIESGESSISAIAVNANIHRRNAYDVMQRLINKGLCFQIFSKGENTYNAVDPDKLTELLAEKQENLRSILPLLKKKFQASIAPEEANRKKIKFIQLFDNEIKSEMPNFPNHFPGDLKYRFLPKKYSTNSALHIFGDFVVTYTGVTLGKTDKNIVIFVIRSKNLAESYRTWFWYMWEQSSEGK